MTRSFTFVLMAVLTLSLASEAHAGRRHDGRRCRKDTQCLSGTCCNGRCSPASAGCDEWASLAAAAGKGKPPPPEKCTNGTSCGACGICKKGKCTGGDTGKCGACQVCNQDGSACIAAPDGSAAANEYYGCGPDHGVGGLSCCGGDCVDISRDSDNCGACGTTCADGKICRILTDGFGCGCDYSETECNGTCADLLRDPNNCGECGNVCASGRCSNGVCECGSQDGCGACETCSYPGLCTSTCSGEQTCCGNGCVDTQFDPDNCGACGNTCGAGSMCCDGGCVDTTSDPNNCGLCGNACADGETCEYGLCRPSLCPEQWFSCGVSYPPHVSDVCCRTGSKCCIGGRNTSCYSEGTCCVTAIGDSFNCGTGFHCCPNSINVPCLPDGTACPPS